MNTLFERIGGGAAVNAAVDIFYQKVLADERIKHFFDGVDMQKQAAHQKMFFTYAFGGAPNYPGRALRVAHQDLVKKMGLNDAHFDAVLENLETTLKELGVSTELTKEVVDLAASTRNDVLNRSA